MTIVPDLADGGAYVPDKSFCTPNRVNAGEPNGTITPQFNGEIIEDTTNNCLWKAVYPLTGVANTCWVAITTPN
jgi:hypothetical protein